MVVAGIVGRILLASSTILSDSIHLGKFQRLSVVSLSMILCLTSTAVLYNGEGGSDLPANQIVLSGCN